MTQHLGENKMAQRVGKYKLTKREAETSLVDGGTVNGTLVVNGDAQISKKHSNFFINKGKANSKCTLFRLNLNIFQGKKLINI